MKHDFKQRKIKFISTLTLQLVSVTTNNDDALKPNYEIFRNYQKLVGKKDHDETRTDIIQTQTTAKHTHKDIRPY